MDTPTAKKFCILGAGTSGLAVAKNFRQAGIEFDCLEREDDIGGNWHFGKPASSVYASTHLISSKRLTEYTDFPMPESYPEFPSHHQVLAYLRDYARTFGLYDHIQFNTSVLKVKPSSAGWTVQLERGEERPYRGVVIANGHNWHPRLPEYSGVFSGEVFHSSTYKYSSTMQGKRVLVVGGGNSGFDLGVEAAIHAKEASISLRRGYHVLPKVFKGKPIDAWSESVLAWRWPLWVRRLGAKLVVRWVLGPPEQAGLPKPDHRLFESHPILNSQLHHHVAHGDLRVRSDIAELQGKTVRFVDGSEAQFDMIIYATGFHLHFPFMDAKYLNWKKKRPQLFLNVFHPERDDLFFAGLIQPDSGQWGLVDYQAQLIARYLQARTSRPEIANWFAQLKRRPQTRLGHGIRYIDSPRHLLEVEHFSYRRRLRKLIAKFS
ncbi:MAG: NAD(P)-binding domain-containing protein [Pirellulales bacterium]|nr:NAD(P)-binding domain-containing protein [Pirellulales bacterium]